MDRTEVDSRMYRMDQAALRPSANVEFIGFNQDPPPRPTRSGPPILIALTSPAMGAGKSVVAQRLIQEHGFILIKFAGALKAMIRALLNDMAIDDRTIERMIEGDLKETPIDALGVTPRRLMQTVGGEWGRDCIRKTFWIDMVRTKVQAWQIIGGGRDIVIDDLRYRNELDLIEELHGFPVRVTRPGIADATGHQSEGELNAIPMETLPNTGTIADLHRLTDGLVQITRARVAAN